MMSTKEHAYRALMEIGREPSGVEIAMVLRSFVPMSELRKMSREELVAKFNEIFAEEAKQFGKELK